MPGPTLLAWYDSALVLLASRPSIAADPGQAGNIVTLYLINNKGGVGAQTEPETGVHGLYRDAGSVNDPVEIGHAWAQGRYGEIRIVGGYNGWGGAPTDWVKLGAGSSLAIPVPIPNDQGVKVEVRLNPPSSVIGVAAEMTLAVDRELAVEAGLGASKSKGDGVILGVRDGGFSEVTRGGAVTQDDAGASKDVDVAATAGVATGIPYAVAAATEVNIPDASAAKNRYDLISISASGVLTRTAGVEDTPPLTNADKPAVPAGHRELAWVQKRDTQNVLDSDIDNTVRRLGLFPLSLGIGRNVTVGRGQALVDGSLVKQDGDVPIPLAASITSRLWLGRSGGWLVTTTAEIPGRGYLLMYEADTDATTVTATRDLRHYVGFDHLDLAFYWPGTLAANTYAYAVNPEDRTIYLLPLPTGAVAASVQDNGGTSGATVFDLEYSDNGGSWTTLYTGAVDRPSIAHDAAAHTDHDSHPLVLAIPPRARVRGKVAAIPAVASVDGYLTVQCAR